MFMRTERLFLRPPFPEDWRQVYSGINDAGVVRMLASAPWPYMPEDAQDYCNTVRDPYNVRLAIALPGTDGAPLIGQIGLGNFSALSTKPESGIDTDFVSRTHVEDPNGEVREEDNITHTKAPTGTDDPPVVDPPDEPPPSGVPEPSSLLLLGAGVPFLLARFRKGRKANDVA